MHNKRGQISEEVMLFIPRIIFLVAVLFAVVLLVKVFLITNIDVKQVEANVLVNRILYSKGGLAYYDENIKRLYPGTVDLRKFMEFGSSNPNLLDNVAISYGFDNPVIAAKITLKNFPSYEMQNWNNLALFYNKGRFDKWAPRALPTVKGGAGSITAFEWKKYVIVKDGEKLVPAMMEFYVIS